MKKSSVRHLSDRREPTSSEGFSHPGRRKLMRAWHSTVVVWMALLGLSDASLAAQINSISGQGTVVLLSLTKKEQQVLQKKHGATLSLCAKRPGVVYGTGKIIDMRDQMLTIRLFRPAKKLERRQIVRLETDPGTEEGVQFMQETMQLWASIQNAMTPSGGAGQFSPITTLEPPRALELPAVYALRFVGDTLVGGQVGLSLSNQKAGSISLDETKRSLALRVLHHDRPSGARIHLSYEDDAANTDVTGGDFASNRQSINLRAASVFEGIGLGLQLAIVDVEVAGISENYMRLGLSSMFVARNTYEFMLHWQPSVDNDVVAEPGFLSLRTTAKLEGALVGILDVKWLRASEVSDNSEDVLILQAGAMKPILAKGIWGSGTLIYKPEHAKSSAGRTPDNIALWGFDLETNKRLSSKTVVSGRLGYRNGSSGSVSRQDISLTAAATTFF